MEKLSIFKEVVFIFKPFTKSWKGVVLALGILVITFWLLIFFFPSGTENLVRVIEALN